MYLSDCVAVLLSDVAYLTYFYPSVNPIVLSILYLVLYLFLYIAI